jgi:hypothetical protein
MIVDPVEGSRRLCPAFGIRVRKRPTPGVQRPETSDLAASVSILSELHGGLSRNRTGQNGSLVRYRKMRPRLRHCVECPRCWTRYLVSFSPYRNGSYLMPLAEGQDEWILYCSCGRPPASSRWTSNELRIYAVSNQAYDRGYGPPEEIVPIIKKSRFSA